MTDSAVNYSTLSAMITPAIFLSANGSLIISTSNRMSRIVDRIRVLNDQGDALCRGALGVDYVHSRIAHASDQLDRLQWRSDRVRLALTMLYLAFAAFVGASLTVALDILVGNRLEFVPTSLSMAGVALLLGASVNLVREAHAALRSNRLEIGFYRDLQRRREAEALCARPRGRTPAEPPREARPGIPRTRGPSPMIAALSLAWAVALPGPAGPIRLHPENPRYFLFRDKPAFLLTSGEHYGAVLNLDFDPKPYLDELNRRGFNFTRTFSGTYREVPGSFSIKDNTLAPRPGRFACPWAIVGEPGKPERFDLDKYDDAYFRRLKAFVADAGDRGIVVEYTLFCPLYDDSLWAVNPMNARNNANGVGNCPREEVYTLKHPDLLGKQLAFVDRAVKELAGFDNLVFEICNEPYFGGVTIPWQKRVAEAIVEAERDRPGKHLIAQNVANGKAKVEPAHPDVGLFNFHYATPPDTIAMNANIRAAIGDDETGFRGTADLPYRVEAWEFLLAGGSTYDNLDYSFTTAHEDGTEPVKDPTPGGGGPALRSQLATLKTFLEGFDFLHMAPDVEAAKRVKGASARVLSKKGGQYAVYLRGGPAATITLALPPGKYRFEWLDPKTGHAGPSGTIEGGNDVTLEAPKFSEDIALGLKAAR